MGNIMKLVIITLAISLIINEKWIPFEHIEEQEDS